MKHKWKLLGYDMDLSSRGIHKELGAQAYLIRVIEHQIDNGLDSGKRDLL